MTPNGVLVVDKPAGPTSHDVVDIVRRLLKTPRVGHTGTLDPMATGVLPLVIGKATRLSRFFAGDRKEYVATLLLGTRTNTFDLEGTVIESRDVRVPRDQIASALEKMSGTFAQQPPAFSAKKVGGTRAHRLARAGSAVAPPPVEVTAFELELVGAADNEAVIRLLTSGGFYVRAFADDLGRQLGCGACLKSLRRTRSGSFTSDRAQPLDHLLSSPNAAAGHVIPMSEVLPDLPAARLTPDGVALASKGRLVGPAEMLSPGDAVVEAAHLRLLDSGGELVAIARRHGASGLLHPSVVLM